jgi:hypothetical protein
MVLSLESIASYQAMINQSSLRPSTLSSTNYLAASITVFICSMTLVVTLYPIQLEDLKNYCVLLDELVLAGYQ